MSEKILIKEGNSIDYQVVYNHVNHKSKLIRIGDTWTEEARDETAVKIKDSGDDLTVKIDGMKFTLDYSQARDLILALRGHELLSDYYVTPISFHTVEFVEEI